MAGRQAKVLAPRSVGAALRHVSRRPLPERERAIILLSVKAGLRACEIAQLEWPMVLDARGQVGRAIELPDRAAKRGSGRRLPLHPDLKRGLVALRRAQGRPSSGPVVMTLRGRPFRPNSIVNWFVTLYHELGFDGCSSHSGRRTFITQAARLAHKAGGSLRDVQLLAGHRSIETTQRYIDGDSDAQHRLVSLI